MSFRNLDLEIPNLVFSIPIAPLKKPSTSSPSSSQPPIIDEKEGARQIVSQLGCKSINPKIFIRLTSYPGQNSLGFGSNDPYALGPVFNEPCPQNLFEIFPYSENVQPLYQHKKAIWGSWNEDIKFEPRPIPNSAWFTWVDRMYIGLKDKWVDLGICDAILTSKSYINPDPPLIAALISFWSTISNTFVFNEGFFISYSIRCIYNVESFH